MSLSCDGYPVTDWLRPAGSTGPYSVDSWQTSFRGSQGEPIMAYRVIGTAGFQLHTERGCVIQFSREYAQSICDAANAGELQEDRKA